MPHFSGWFCNHGSIMRLNEYVLKLKLSPLTGASQFSWLQLLKSKRHFLHFLASSCIFVTVQKSSADLKDALHVARHNSGILFFVEHDHPQHAWAKRDERPCLLYHAYLFQLQLFPKNDTIFAYGMPFLFSPLQPFYPTMMIVMTL